MEWYWHRFLSLAMRNPVSGLLLSAALITAFASPARGQAALDRVVGPDRADAPVVITKLDGQTVGRLALAVGVPMGLERAPAVTRNAWTIPATGRQLREVLDAIVAADPRYEWREDNGVIVFRPQSARADVAGVLGRRIEALKLDNLDSAEALTLITGLLGGPAPDYGLADSKRLSLDLPAGSTVLDVLNAVVREHGTLAWTLEDTNPDATPAYVDHPLTVSLFIGDSGMGMGLPGTAAATKPLVNGSTMSRASLVARSQGPLLDQIVGSRRNGRPLVLGGISPWVVADLAAATGVPMGIETPSPEKLPALRHPGFEGFMLTGLPLRDALLLLGRLDPRYEWREVDGVIVFRTIDAWHDVDDPLFRLVRNVRLDDVPGSKAVDVVLSHLGVRNARSNFTDTRHLSLELPQGSVLDLLNAVARSHGEMSWQWEEVAVVERTSERHYQLTFSLFVGGVRSGYAIP